MQAPRLIARFWFFCSQIPDVVKCRLAKYLRRASFVAELQHGQRLGRWTEILEVLTISGLID